MLDYLNFFLSSKASLLLIHSSYRNNMWFGQLRECFVLTFFLIWMFSFPPLLLTSSCWLKTCHSCYSQEHHVRTGQGSVSVIVCGDQDKPPLITYPDLALNRKCLELSLCCDFGGDILDIWFLVISCEITFKWCVSLSSCRYVVFSRIILFPGSSFIATSQLLHLPYQPSWTWGLYYCWVNLRTWITLCLLLNTIFT